MTHPIKSPRKLIEVALPLNAINVASAREKAIRHGHPSTLHTWWARRPLAAARAVIFAQLVNDPGYQQGGGFKYGKNKKDAAIERKRLFKLIEDLVLWQNTTNEEVLERARIEIRRSWREVCDLNRDHPQAATLFDPEKLPALHDPFAGGGSIPIEAQRLGLEAYASDLNPVSVLINKALIEIPPKFAGTPPVNSEARKANDLRNWKGTYGLAEDVRFYGKWVRDEAEKRIGHLYQTIRVTQDMTIGRPDLKPYLGKKLTVIAWLWARTVQSPNPAFSHIHVPLASSFQLSTQDGKQAYVQPVLNNDGYCFTVKTGQPEDEESVASGTMAGKRSAFRCLMSGSPIGYDHIRSEAQAGRMGERMLAIVVDGIGERLYLSPTAEAEAIANGAKPMWRPDVEFFQEALGFRVGNYGMTKWSDLFTNRQLTALSTLSDLVHEARERISSDALAAGLSGDEPLATGGVGAKAYADAVTAYLAIAVSKEAVFLVTQARWRTGEGKSAPAFGRQAIPMVWDFADLNPFAGAGGDFYGVIEGIAKTLRNSPPPRAGHATQAEATTQTISRGKVVSTDPPYYDNVGYADLSDFFYVWLRRTLRPVFPELFTTVAVPKAEELVATAERHGGAEKAEAFFLTGMTEAMHRLAEQAHPAFPVTIYYAFKQSERDAESNNVASTGWETFLEAVIRAGFATSGTWPMRTENKSRLRGQSSNALASSIVLVCRKRTLDAPAISRREFMRELNAVLPEALYEMTRGSGDDQSPVAPVDLSQAIIGPGMAVFSKYSAVLESDGSPMSVRAALQLINRFLAEDDFDADTQFCLHWFEENGWGVGMFGQADTLSRAKGTSVDGVRVAGVIESGGGNVRLLKWSEYPADWDPRDDSRNPVWETLHQLIRALKHEGEAGAGRLLAMVGGKAEATRQLAYRLYTLCERQGWAEDARAYNELITSWTGIEAAASAVPGQKQTELF